MTEPTPQTPPDPIGNLVLRWTAAARYYSDLGRLPPRRAFKRERKVRFALFRDDSDRPGLARQTEDVLWAVLRARSADLRGEGEGSRVESPGSPFPAARIAVDSHWLRLFLLLRVLRYLRRRRDIPPIRALVDPDDTRFFSRVEVRIELFGELCAFARDTLRYQVEGVGRRASIDVQAYATALLKLVAFVVHDELGVPHVLDVFGHLSGFARQELLLHLGKPFYRDHLFHVVDTFLFGLLLLETHHSPPGEHAGGYRFAADLLMGCDGARSRPSTSDIECLLRGWAVTSLFHDLGYLLEVPCRVEDDYPYASIAGWRAIAETADRGHSAFEGEAARTIALDREQILGQSPPPDLERELDRCLDGGGMDHGLTSAWYLRALLDRTGVEEDWCAPAVEAVLLHNLQAVHIDWDERPLAGLLALCDEVQEWGRHRIDGAAFGPGALVAAHFEHLVELPLRGSVHAIELGPVEFAGEAIDDRRFVVEDPRKLALRLSYGARRWPAPPALIWLSKAYNLQRICSQARDVEVRIDTPVEPKLQALHLTYQNLLATVFVRSPGTELALLLRRWVTANHWRRHPESGDKVTRELVILRVARDRSCRYLDLAPGPFFRQIQWEIDQIIRESLRARIDEVDPDGQDEPAPAPPPPAGHG